VAGRPLSARRPPTAGQWQGPWFVLCALPPRVGGRRWQAACLVLGAPTPRVGGRLLGASPPPVGGRVLALRSSTKGRWQAVAGGGRLPA